jgi:hypothetical protein
VKHYHVSYVTPSAGPPRKDLYRIEKNKQGKFVPGRIVVSNEEVFFAIDECIGHLSTWVRRGPGTTAEANTTISPRHL